MTASPIQTVPPTNNIGDIPEDKETDLKDHVVDFSSGNILTVFGFLICLIILAANLYVLATL